MSHDDPAATDAAAADGPAGTGDATTTSDPPADGADDPAPSVARLYREAFGFTWGTTGDTVWVRNADGEYKRVDREFLDRLRELARTDRDPASVDERVARAIEHLSCEGYLRPGEDVVRHETPPDVRLWPRAGAFAVLVGAAIALLGAHRAELRELFGTLDAGTGPTVGVVLPALVVATALHELGHYAVSRRYFDPAIRFELLNKVVPAVVTRTTDAWGCPRNVRIWISLAGPLVEAALAAGLALVFVVLNWSVAGLLAFVLLARIAFVLNPLIEGDGYWILVDAFGLHNLRSRGFRDLRARRVSGPAAYAAAVVVFTAGLVVAVGSLVVGHLVGLP